MDIETKKQELINALNLMIEAGQNAEIPLDMFEWHCGFSCCLCGDVSVYQNKKAFYSFELSAKATDFANKLDKLCIGVTGELFLVKSIYDSTAIGRNLYAVKALSENHLLIKHPHVTTNHNDRTIAHDYIRQVIAYIKSYEGAE